MRKTKNCYRCAHYLVTWDETFPHGCSLLGFRAAKIPSAVVLESTGEDCKVYEEKNGPGGKPVETERKDPLQAGKKIDLEA